MAQPVLTDITRIEFDPQFSPGAYNAVNTCLRILPSEKVTLITDNACREIAASIAQELAKVGCKFKAYGAGRSRSAPFGWPAPGDRGGYGDQRREHLRRAGADQ